MIRTFKISEPINVLSKHVKKINRAHLHEKVSCSENQVKHACWIYITYVVF